MKKLSVVVCVYNEELNIKPLIDKITAAVEHIDYEILYVDDLICPDGEGVHWIDEEHKSVLIDV